MQRKDVLNYFASSAFKSKVFTQRCNAAMSFLRRVVAPLREKNKFGIKK